MENDAGVGAVRRPKVAVPLQNLHTLTLRRERGREEGKRERERGREKKERMGEYIVRERSSGDGFERLLFNFAQIGQ